ncbi:MAG TPA: Ig-like domain-containing protein, partial [Gemmatimonadaceae bacterium]|nr:Ig-like domain-containing protein [Gemmatimonadaceae bacterium]
MAASTDTLRAVVGGSAGNLQVIVKNKAGDLIDSALVTFSVTSGAGSVGNPSVRTVSGLASTTWTLGPSVGLQTVTATVGTLTVTFNAIASAAAASNIAKLAGDQQTALVATSVPILPSVKVTDAFGNPVAGALVTFTVNSGGGLANGAAVNTGADGVATLAGWRLGNAAGANTLTAATGALAVTFTATGVAGSAASLTLTPSTIPSLTTGQTVQLSAKAT